MRKHQANKLIVCLFDFVRALLLLLLLLRYQQETFLHNKLRCNMKQDRERD